jgi:transposase
MGAKIYLPQVLRSFQGFQVLDIKEWSSEKRMEIILEHDPEVKPLCEWCGLELGVYHDRYSMRVKHMRIMDWKTELRFWKHRHWCSFCKKNRSEKIKWLCPSSPHVTMELSWWINRLTEIATVLQVSRLESLDKKTCYRIDKEILTRLLQGYKIPEVRGISVDEVYARGPDQLKEGEDRNDLFLTIVADLKTHKVIWVSDSRNRSALDDFFKLLGPEACKKIEMVACDQHKDYALSVRDNCKNATLVWDRFHLVQRFNEALNDDRMDEYKKLENWDEAKEMIRGKYKHKFLTKADRRDKRGQWHIHEAGQKNYKIYMLELIKEHFHKVFESPTRQEAVTHMRQCLRWAADANAKWILKLLNSYYRSKTFWNYFTFRISSGLSEGINRAIKTLKWAAYGYKDMFYFALKIMQRHGYLNSLYHLRKFP